ncbi:uncharacterized protein CMU_031180 [Cryptosporidium muris RN66]|uniref:Uncharacterized protein n=1 Tax=Cryptosporidium muris (strain RN66) TaxID=441375 RepID=B6AID6_CRYMR|nr:uncharacterized protein CMU_031180 [Cryptosporidium muris RN66]EEA07977.1 hypothetical protein, conserved [Cryptosporidium muris RN66]|eukprot:XP_002142326.1 hypothetical protein [Cryptosporidium muris RN66]
MTNSQLQSPVSLNLKTGFGTEVKIKDKVPYYEEEDKTPVKKYSPVHRTTGAPLYRTAMYNSDKINIANSLLLPSIRSKSFNCNDDWNIPSKPLSPASTMTPLTPNYMTSSPLKIESPNSISSVCCLTPCMSPNMKISPNRFADLYRNRSWVLGENESINVEVNNNEELDLWRHKQKPGNKVELLKKGLNSEVKAKPMKVVNTTAVNTIKPIKWKINSFDSGTKPSSPKSCPNLLVDCWNTSPKYTPTEQIKAPVKEFKDTQCNLFKEPLKTIRSPCKNIKGAIESIEYTGKFLASTCMYIANLFDFDSKDIQGSLQDYDHFSLCDLPAFPVVSVEIPTNTVILQCMECDMLFYSELPLTKQQLSSIGILEPDPIPLGNLGPFVPNDEIFNRDSPFYCWGNMQPRELSPNQIEYLKSVDLRTVKRLSIQDIVDLYYYRYRRDRRFEKDFLSSVMVDDRLHLYKFYRETLHAANNGNKTPLPDVGDFLMPSPWDPIRTSKSRKPKAPNKDFELDSNGFVILPQLPKIKYNIRDKIFTPDISPSVPFILDRVK